MAKGFVCPTDEQQWVTAIIYWKPPKQMVKHGIDKYYCHLCGLSYHGETHEVLPEGWQPEIEWPISNKRAGQVNIFGEIDNIDRVINPLPRMIRSPAGLWVGQYSIDQKHQGDKKYLARCREMIRDIEKYTSDWPVKKKYQFRTAWYKRVKNGRNEVY